MNWLPYVITIFITLVNAYAAYLIKIGGKQVKLNLSIIKNTKLIIGACLYILSGILFIYALSLEQLFILTSLSVLTYIWTGIIGVKILGEKLTLKNWFGILLIILGVTLVTVF